MNHAILIITHGNEQIACKTIQLYDDHSIDFYILVDKNADFNFRIFDKINSKSNIYFIKSHKVYWGDYSQIEAELILLKKAVQKEYDYYHLVSGTDLPLLSKTEFIHFFAKNNGVEFVEFIDEKVIPSSAYILRVNFFHFFVKYEKSQFKLISSLFSFLHRLIIKIQKVIRFNRNKKNPLCFKFGGNWFDITHEFALEILGKRTWIKKTFSFSFCGDELFIQTIMHNSRFINNNYLNQLNKQVFVRPRYVDWKRGNPYTFRSTDFNELIKTRTALFARKFDYKLDSNIIELLTADIRSRENK